VRFEDRTSSLCCIGVWGPLARELVGSVSADDLSNEALPYMRAARIDIGAVPCRALRLSYVGELGWEIYAGSEFGRMLGDTLWEAGRGLGACACGGGAYDSLRLEKGYRLWGQDIDEEHDPYEAGLGWAVALSQAGGSAGRAPACILLLLIVLFLNYLGWRITQIATEVVLFLNHLEKAFAHRRSMPLALSARARRRRPARSAAAPGRRRPPLEPRGAGR